MKGDASQKFVPIKTIHQGVVELDSGGFVYVLMASSVNLALKSSDEQSAIINQFQNFFNSLDFPVQIFIKSRRANIDGYIAQLQDRYKLIDNDLLKLQTSEYIDYIKNFVAEVNIMEKQFYIVVSYQPAIVGEKSVGGLSGLMGGSKSSVEDKVQKLERIKQQLDERVSVVMSGLTRCGIKLKKLETEDVIELFYSLFNPGIEAKTIIN